MGAPLRSGGSPAGVPPFAPRWLGVPPAPGFGGVVMGLTPVVDAAVEKAIELVDELVREMSHA